MNTLAGSFTPYTMDDIVLPVNIASIATKVLAVGATVVVAVLGVWIAFRLINAAATRIAIATTSEDDIAMLQDDLNDADFSGDRRAYRKTQRKLKRRGIWTPDMD